MPKFKYSILALILTPILSAAQTPAPAADGGGRNTSQSGVITGRVTDPQGRPAVEERIRIYRLDNSRKPTIAYFGKDPDRYLTDDRGAYRIYGLTPGRYLVSAGYLEQEENGIHYPTPKFYHPQTFHPSVAEWEKAKPIDITEGTEATGIDIVLSERRRSYDIHGRVLSLETGKPVAGVSLSYGVVSEDGKHINSKGLGSAPSNSDGNFRLTNVASGKYVVIVQNTATNDYLNDPINVEVGESDLEGLEVKVWKGASISGIAFVEGTSDPSVLAMVNKVQLMYRPVSPEQWNQPIAPSGAGINPDGSFHLRAIQPGKVRIFPYLEAVTPGLVLSRIERNGAPLRDGIEVVAGEQVTGVRLAFTYGALTLRGQVKITGLSMAQGLRWYVFASRPDLPPQYTTLSAAVDAQGAFILEHLSPGEYVLSIGPMGDLDPKLVQAIFSRRHRVVVTETPPPITITLDLGDLKNEK
jgi:protocatechuate 3,4-dioxygenase beta subunit